MKVFKKITVLTLTVCLLVSSMGLTSAYAKEKDYFPEVTSSTIPYSEMSHELLDMDYVEELVADIEECLAAKSPDADVLAAGIAELFELYNDCYYTAARLTNDTNISPADSSFADKYEQCNKDFLTIDTYLIELGKKAFATAAGETVKAALDERAVAYIEESKTLSEEEKAVLNEIDTLIAEYNRICNTVFTHEVDGVEYTSDDFTNLYTTRQITDEEYYEYTAITGAKYNEFMSDVYFKLVDARTRLAKLAGYDNYYEYSANEYFFRGSTVKQVDTYKAAVKKYMTPLYSDINFIGAYGMVSLYNCDAYYSEDFELSTLTDSVGEYIKDLSSEMYDSYEYMMDMGLCDLINPGDRVPTTYQITVDRHTPFIMNGFSNTYGSLAGSLFHEFGHSNEARYFDENCLVRLDYDLAEVHSTALESLSMPYYGGLFGEDVQSDIEDDFVATGAYMALFGCVIDDLEQFVYIDGADSMMEISEYYATLLKEYKMIPENDPRTALYAWTGISHLFLSPCYYISYALSNTAALEIFALSKEDYDNALDTYLTLCGAGIDMHFEDTLEAASLATPFKAKNIKALVDSLYETMNIDERIAAIEASLTQEYEDYKIYKIKSGDTLGKIAADHKVPMEDIIAMNKIENPAMIYAGDVLVLPETAVMQKATYTIQPGDTLYEIAKAFDASMESIAMQNGIIDMTKIFAGDVLEFEY